MRLTLACVVLIAGFPASAASDERVPRIGLAGDDLDACLTLGQVAGDPDEEASAQRLWFHVYAAPDARAPEKPRLRDTQHVWLCDKAGDWLGVVYSRDGNEWAPDCGVGTPVASVRPYRGPCEWGWIQARYVEAIAG